MKNILSVLLSVLYFGLVEVPVHAETPPKVLVVDMVKVYDGHYKTEEFNAGMKIDQQKAEADLQKLNSDGNDMVKQFNELKEEFNKQATSSDVKAKIQKDLELKGQDIQRKQAEVNSFRSNVQLALKTKIDNFKNPLLSEISDTAIEIAQDKGATLLFDKSGRSFLRENGLVKLNSEYELTDITDDVLVVLNKGRQGSTSTSPGAQVSADNTVTGDTTNDFTSFFMSGNSLTQIGEQADAMKKSGGFVFKNLWLGMPIADYIKVMNEILVKHGSGVMVARCRTSPAMRNIPMNPSMRALAQQGLSDEQIQGGLIPEGFNVMDKNMTIILKYVDFSDIGRYSRSNGKWLAGGVDLRTIQVNEFTLDPIVIKLMFGDSSITADYFIRTFIEKYGFQVPSVWTPDHKEIQNDGSIIKTYRLRDPRGVELIFTEVSPENFSLILKSIPSQKAQDSSFN